jgi:hypothetical protein
MFWSLSGKVKLYGERGNAPYPTDTFPRSLFLAQVASSFVRPSQLKTIAREKGWRASNHHRAESPKNPMISSTLVRRANGRVSAFREMLRARCSRTDISRADFKLQIFVSGDDTSMAAPWRVRISSRPGPLRGPHSFNAPVERASRTTPNYSSDHVTCHQSGGGLMLRTQKVK